MPKKNVDIVLNNLDGTPILKPSPAGTESISMTTKKEPENLTVKSAVCDALLLGRDTERMSGEDSARRYKLALKVNDGGDQDFTLEELVLIKKLVGVTFGPLIVGQVFLWAEGELPVKPADPRPDAMTGTSDTQTNAS